MRRSILLAFMAALFMVGFHTLNAETVGLANFIVNDNGTITAAGFPVIDGNINLSSFDQTPECCGAGTGPNTLGSISVTLSPGLGQYVAMYADYDVDYFATTGGGSFYDIGNPNTTTPPLGYSYSLTDASQTVDSDQSLDAVWPGSTQTGQPFTTCGNINDVGTSNGPLPAQNTFDVDWCLGLAGIDAPLGGSVTFVVSTMAPNLLSDPSGFYIQQTNIYNNDSIYAWANVDITPSTPPPSTVPEPSFVWLLAACVPVFVLWRRRKQAQAGF